MLMQKTCEALFSVHRKFSGGNEKGINKKMV